MQQVQQNWTRARAWLGRQSNAARLGRGIGALVLFMVGCALGAVVEGARIGVSSAPVAQGNGSQATQATGTHARPTATSAPPTGTAKPATWVTVAHITGNQNQTTGNYHVPNGARIVWSATSAGQYGGNISIETDSASDSRSIDLIANTGVSGTQTGTTVIHQDYDLFFKISALNCSYDIQIQVYR